MGVSDLQSSVPRAAKMLDAMANPKHVSADKAIPKKLLQNCLGIAFITVYKAGLFILGGNLGGGCVIAKVADESAPDGFRWSAPISVTVGGLGGGFIFGGERISSIIILNTKSAIQGFMGDKQVTFGGSASLAVGPVGREAAANVGLSDNKEIVPSYSYSLAKGAYIGGTLEGAILKLNEKDMSSFYGRPVTAADCLNGLVTAPLSCNALYEMLGMIVADSHMGSTSRSTPPADNSNLGASGKALLRSGFADGDEQLAPGWKEAKAPDGKVYYYNDAGETRWDKPVAPRPVAPRPTPPPPPPPKPAGPPPLPAGWEELTTDDGKKYYSNGVTTQWDRPSA